MKCNASRHARALTSRGSGRVLEKLVSRLKTQLAQKDKRLAQLKEAIKELGA